MAPATAVDVLWSPKRGVGATTLVAAAAVRHATAGENVAVLDLADGDASALVSLLSERPRDPADNARALPARIDVRSDAANAPIAVYARGTQALTDPGQYDSLIAAAASDCDRLIVDAGTRGVLALYRSKAVLVDARVSCSVVLANCYLAAQAAAAACCDALMLGHSAEALGYHHPLVVVQRDRNYTVADLVFHLQQITGQECAPTIVARSRHVAAAIDSASITQRLPRSLQRFETSPNTPPPYQDRTTDLLATAQVPSR